MRRSQGLYTFPLLAAFSTLSSGLTLDCGRLQNEGYSWDLSPLDGPHSVSHSESTGPTVHNTTYTLDICKPLKGSECKGGTWVCGALTIVPEKGDPILDGYTEIAGSYFNDLGRTLDPIVKRLKGGETHREGLRLELHGGRHPINDKNGESQQAVIDFICDRDRTGLEGEDKAERARNYDGYSGSDTGSNNNNTSLRYKGYHHEEGAGGDVLRLEWLTKYACADYEPSDGDSGGSNHWGFFTWLIVLLFLCASAYLIFGSWMNYSRYGARGWDMLPHSDTIRDIPYLLKDWLKRVVTTIQGPGSRGGYSAV